MKGRRQGDDPLFYAVAVTSTLLFSDVKGTERRHKTLNPLPATVPTTVLAALAVLWFAGPAAALVNETVCS